MALYIKTGQYTGDATDDRAITGIGFQPSVVIIIKTTSGTGEYTSASVPAGTSFSMQSSSTGNSNRIQAILSDGFEIGTANQVNQSGSNFKYICIGGDSADIVTGSYTGNGSDNRDITGIGFQPALVIIKGTTNDQIVFKYTAMGDAVDLSQAFTNISNYTNAIQALQSDGFQVGTNAVVNTSATPYYYVAIKANSSILASGTYVGNGTDNRDITGIGFQPDYVWTKTASSGSAHRTNSYAGDSSTFLASPAGGSGANYIQSLLADGFQIGTASEVNTNTIDYWWIAFKENSASAIKTINGIAKGSVKTLNGLATASMKTFNGLQ